MPFIRRFPWFVSLVGKQNTRKRPLRLRNQRLNDEPTPTKTAIAPQKTSVRKFLLTSGIVQYGHSARQRDVTRAGGTAKPFTDFDNAAASLFLNRQRRVAIQ